MRLLYVLFFVTTYGEAKEYNPDKRNTKQQEANMDLLRKIDTLSESFNRPVPFGHIFRDGFEDPTGELKQPIDLLELQTIYTKVDKETRDFLKAADIGVQRIMNSPSQLNAKEQAIYYGQQRDEPDPKPLKGKDGLQYFKLSSIQQKNLYDPPSRRFEVKKERPKRPEPYAPSAANHNHKIQYFSKGSFALESDRVKVPYNFTTCDEFGRNAKFYPDDIVNIDWVPFYIWTTETSGRVLISSVHKFSHPTKKLVKKYIAEFKNHLNKTIDWEQPMLLMKGGMMEMLLIAADRRGLFDAIPYNEIPEDLKKTNVQVPMTSLRLKIVDPYLGMMYCDSNYATLMAVSGNEPPNMSKRLTESSLLKINGPGFPVARDVEMEQLQQRSKAEGELRRNRDKFIDVNDQFEAARPKYLS